MEQVTDHILAAARKVIAVHLNYPTRAAQRGRTPEQPSYFLKPSSSLARRFGSSPSTVERPAGTELLAFEGEIALVIGKPARRVGLEDAWSHVAWVTAATTSASTTCARRTRAPTCAPRAATASRPSGPGLIDARTRRPRRPAAAHLGQRRARPGRHHRRTCSSRSPSSSPTCPSTSPSSRATSSSPAPRPGRRWSCRATSSRSRSTRRRRPARSTSGRLVTTVTQGTTPFDGLRRAARRRRRPAGGGVGLPRSGRRSHAAEPSGRRACPRS